MDCTRGLTRFIAVCLLSGYVWLALGGAVIAVAGLAPGSPAYDAALHALLVGFVFMVFGHAPIIFPAVLRVDVPYHPAFYAPLVLLHASLLARLAGDAARQFTWHAGSDIPQGWSPDGKRLLFGSRRDTPNYAIYSLDVATLRTEVLAEDYAPLTSPDYSPNGRTVVYGREASSHHATSLLFPEIPKFANLPAPSRRAPGPSLSPPGRRDTIARNEEGCLSCRWPGPPRRSLAHDRPRRSGRQASSLRSSPRRSARGSRRRTRPSTPGRSSTTSTARGRSTGPTT